MSFKKIDILYDVLNNLQKEENYVAAINRLFKRLSQIFECNSSILVEYDKKTKIFKSFKWSNINKNKITKLSIMNDDILNLIKHLDKYNLLYWTGKSEKFFSLKIKKLLELQNIFIFCDFNKNDLARIHIYNYENKIPDFLIKEKAVIKMFFVEIELLLCQLKRISKYNELLQKENLFKSIVEKIRSTLDLSKVNEIIVETLGQSFQADRCFIASHDAIYKKMANVSYEYLSNKNLLSIKGVLPNFEITRLTRIAISGDNIKIPKTDKYIKQNNLQNTLVEDYFNKYNIKSNYAIALVYAGITLGVVEIHFTEKYKEFNKNEFEIIKSICNQAAITLYQVDLYSKIKNSAYSDKVLREIVTEIKLSQTLDHVYKYIIKKFAQIFNSDRVLFIEISPEKTINKAIKYEYLKLDYQVSLKEITIPDKYFRIIDSVSKNPDPFVINDISEHYTENEDLIDFFKAAQIHSFMIIPLLRYNNEVKILGCFMISSSSARVWTNEEISLFKKITESIVHIIWDISKIIELDKEKDIFINTLAHDLQVPLIGESKALEFLISKQTKKTNRYADILFSLAENNSAIIETLQQLLEIYKFESDKKILRITQTNLSSLISIIIKSLKEKIKEKNIVIEINFEKDIPKISLDKSEINKVLFVLIENAITYNQSDGFIKISGYLVGDAVIVCVSDSGIGVSEHAKDIIFQRYQMSKSIERKVGSGLKLYLCKLIIKAHKGNIYYETEINKGSTFCFKIPVKQTCIQ
jgi:signal transduction histidine kinase